MPGGQLRKEYTAAFTPSSALTIAPTRSFEPWHKPRKQFIRKFQWIKETEAILSRIGLDDGRPLKYLSLPGEDMLDIRVLHKLCLKRNVTLKYLGFKTGRVNEDYDRNISVNEVSKLPYVHKDSEMVVDDIRSAGRPGTKGHDSFKKLCPFDVINFDICDCILEKSVNPYPVTYFYALYAILNLQLANTTKPWLLFITTRSTAKDVGNDAAKMWDCVLDNANSHVKFKSALEGFLGTEIKSGHSYKDICQLNPSIFTGFFGIGIGKWFLKLMMTERPLCSVKMLEGYHFRAGGSKNPNMLSVAFLFEPIPTSKSDKYGIVKQPLKLNSPPTEEEVACEIIKSAKGIGDLDSIMKDEKLMKEMYNETKSLLEDAHYSVAGYDKWLAKNGARV
ncbi:MAG: hypothetical protein U9Q92_03500 [archaeon]|nr:hypothetical protein [archaeon]